MMRIARVFPRKTTASPDDELAFYSDPPSQPLDVDEVHVSVTFSYDVEKAVRLFETWSEIYSNVKIGGPALEDPGADFISGLYLKPGYVITSRGCPNRCWFCDVPRREGDIRELPIVDGWNLLDSNILACSNTHIRNVFAMLSRQKHPIELTGGLEAACLTDHHVSMLWHLRPKQVFFAYDTPDDLEPLIHAGEKMRYADFTRAHLRCYVLIGYPHDTFDLAEKRLIEAWTAGFMPMAMLWKNKNGDEDTTWRRFQREWARPAAIRGKMKKRYILQEGL